MLKPQKRIRGSELSLADRTKESLRRAIMDGQFRPAQRLSIEQVASELGVSRTPVREALKALESDGMIRLERGRSAVVSVFDEAEIYDRYSLRASIEGYAGQLACERGSDRLARQLQEDCDELAGIIERSTLDKTKIRDLIAANNTFHNRILEEAQSATVVRVLEMLRMPVAYRNAFWADGENQRRCLEWHRNISKAFEKKDLRAIRETIEAHLSEARDQIIAIQSAI